MYEGTNFVDICAKIKTAVHIKEEQRQKKKFSDNYELVKGIAIITPLVNEIAKLSEFLSSLYQSRKCLLGQTNFYCDKKP